MSHQLKWTANVAPSPHGLYSIATIFGRYHAVLSHGGKDLRIGGDFLTPAKAKAAAQADCAMRDTSAQEGQS